MLVIDNDGRILLMPNRASSCPKPINQEVGDGLFVQARQGRKGRRSGADTMRRECDPHGIALVLLLDQAG